MGSFEGDPGLPCPLQWMMVHHSYLQHRRRPYFLPRPSYPRDPHRKFLSPQLAKRSSGRFELLRIKADCKRRYGTLCPLCLAQHYKGSLARHASEVLSRLFHSEDSSHEWSELHSPRAQSSLRQTWVIHAGRSYTLGDEKHRRF